MPTPGLYCEVCDRDASDTVVIARWRNSDVCTDCLYHYDQMMEDEARDADKRRAE